jgi:hypothetical protein
MTQQLDMQQLDNAARQAAGESGSNPGLSSELFEDLMSLVRSYSDDTGLLRGCLATAERELAALRQRATDGCGAAALRLADAKAELFVALALLRRSPRLSSEDRALMAPYANGDFLAADLLPHSTYRLTADWVTRHEALWRNQFSSLAGQPDLHFLEIGCYEGNSTCWWLDNILTHPTSSITCIDPFVAHADQERHFDFNIAAARAQDRVKKIKAFSFDTLRRLPQRAFDLAYIDGSHLAIDVAQDALLTWPLLKPGALCLFDDYAFDQKYPEVGGIRWARRGIDGMLVVVDGWYEVLHRGYQLLIRKIC